MFQFGRESWIESDNCSRSEMGRAKGMNLFENLFGIDVIVRSFLIIMVKRIYFVILFFSLVILLVIYFIDKFKVSPINHFYYIERNMLEKKYFADCFYDLRLDVWKAFILIINMNL